MFCGYNLESLNSRIDLEKLKAHFISSMFLRYDFERNHKCETTLTSFTLRVSFIHLELNERSHSGPIQKRMCVSSVTLVACHVCISLCMMIMKSSVRIIV